jgi:hypothetical protein
MDNKTIQLKKIIKHILDNKMINMNNNNKLIIIKNIIYTSIYNKELEMINKTNIYWIMILFTLSASIIHIV